MRIMRILLFFVTMAVLTGCSSGGDDAALVSPPPSVIDPTLPPPIVIASLEALTSNPQIPSDDALPVTITALLKDANNNFVAGNIVAFAADSGGVAVTQAETDAQGRATATLSAAGNPANRIINVTATTGTLSATVAVQVIGTQLSITGPNSLVQGATATFTMVLADASGSGIPGRTVDLTSSLSNTLSATTLTTDFSGQAQFTYTAVNGGSDNLTATALGEQAATTVVISSDDFIFTTPAEGTEVELDTPQNLSVRWLQNNQPVTSRAITFSTTRGTFTTPASVVTNASGVASVTVQATNAGSATVSAVASNGPTTTRRIEFVATQPAEIEVQADPFTVSPNGQSTITAVLRDPAGNLVKNKSISFELTDITGGTLSVGSAITDSLGRAQTFYTSTAVTSSVNGVKVKASVDENPAINDEIQLTVAGRQVFFTFGTGNTISEPNEAQYEKIFVVQVTDADGRAVSGVSVAMSVTSVTYVKGFYWPSVALDGWPRFSRERCADEDFNRNGILDPGEDLNGSLSIEAGNVATVTPGSFDSDANGFGLVSLFYPQEHGGWLEVELQARTAVQGTEFSERSVFNLSVLADDVNDLDVSPPGRDVTINDLVEAGIPTGPESVGEAIGIGSGSTIYNLIVSPWGYNPGCDVFDF